MKELVMQAEDERRHADQYKEQVGWLRRRNKEHINIFVKVIENVQSFMRGTLCKSSRWTR